MRAFVFVFVMGALFGSGLIVAGMTDPANVQGFLDITGDWRPQLLAVLGTGVAVTTLLFIAGKTLATKQHTPWAAAQFHWPTRRDLDARLIGGSVLFGTGWALAGYCPGPALTVLGSLNAEALLFVPAMAAGMWVAQRWRA